jgi:ABC-2 type transport system ATP-binding protein
MAAPSYDVAAPAVRLDAVTRRFRAGRAPRGRGHGDETREVVAVDAVSLTLERGRVMGLLGPNGAGKTTLLRIICTLLAPSAGRVEVLGHDPTRDPQAVRARVGAVLGGERAVYWRLSGLENLLYAGALHGMEAGAARARAAELLRWTGLFDRADDLVETYSTGMRLRVCLARALMHDPHLLVLDEPTAGLDPHGARGIGLMLREWCRDGRRSILLATHNMPEAERVCDVVAVLDRGRVLAVEAPAALAARVPNAAGLAPTLETAFLAMTPPTGAMDRRLRP